MQRPAGTRDQATVPTAQTAQPGSAAIPPNTWHLNAGLAPSELQNTTPKFQIRFITVQLNCFSFPAQNHANHANSVSGKIPPKQRTIRFSSPLWVFSVVWFFLPMGLLLFLFKWSTLKSLSFVTCNRSSLRTSVFSALWEKCKVQS